MGRLLLLLCLIPLLPMRAEETALLAIRSLTDEARIQTLKGDRPCNDRLLKVLYWLNTASQQGQEVHALMSRALAGHSRPSMTKDALLRNARICESLGLFSPDNLAKMRRGVSPVIERGPYAGEIAEVDHILPVSLFPQYDRAFWNLELMPRPMNRQKAAKIGDRQRALLQRIASGER